MSIRDKLADAMPFIAGIGIPIGVLMAGFALPIAYDLKGDVGGLKISVEEINKKLDSVDGQIKILVSQRGDLEAEGIVFVESGETCGIAYAKPEKDKAH